MPWCLVCKAEYREGFKVCSECNSPLVEDLNECQLKDEEITYDHEVYLTTVSTEVEADIIESLLRANEIPVLRKHREAGGYLYITTGNSITGIDLYVPSAALTSAEELIDSSNEVDGNEDTIQDEEEKKLLIKAEKKFRKRRAFIAFILLLFFGSALLMSIINLVEFLWEKFY